MGASTPGFRVILWMQIRPGMAGDFERTWREIADVVTNNPANMGH
jgi:hypothetical protein